MSSSTRRDQVIQQLRGIASDLSGYPVENLRPDVSFLELGFDSLFLTQLGTSYQKAFGVRITFRQLFDELPTMEAIGTYIVGKLPQESPVVAESLPVKPATAPEVSTPIAQKEPVASVHSPAKEPVQMVVAPSPSAAPPPAPRTALRPQRSPQPNEVKRPVDGVEAVFLRQLELMTEQLRILQGSPLESDFGLSSAAADLAQEIALPAPSEEITAPAVAAMPAAAANEITPPVKTAPATALPAGFGPADAKKSGSQELPPQQKEHLDQLIQHYTRKTAGSKRRTQQFRGPLADPRTAAGFNRRWKEMVYPLWVERSSGSKLWDVDGNEYIDLLNGFGPNFLGHSPAFITKAMEDQLHRGIEIGPQTPLVGEVAEMICQLTGMDRASFTCSGSEAVQAAMRLSRTVTGRDKVVLFSRDYHGNFDQVLVREGNRSGKLRTFPSAPGIPMQSVDDTYVLEYGTKESLDLIQQYSHEIAAVMVEPVQSRKPELQPREFLLELRRVTRETGILLVFDEVITGFRVAPGGAQEYYGIEADLATYGKVIGGGMPIGVVAGRAAVMDTFDGGHWQYGDDSFPGAGVTFFAGTFVRHPLVIAAAHATLKHLIAEGPALQERVTDKATRFATQISELFQRYEIAIEIPQFSSLMYLRIKEHAELANLLYSHLRYRGVHILEGFPCYMTDAHSEEDLKNLVRAFTDSVEAMVEAGIFGRKDKLPQNRSSEVMLSPLLAATSVELNGVPAIAASATEYPPTEGQREMWIAAQVRPEASAASNGSNVVEITGELDVSAFKRAIAEVVSRHEALRCTFSPDGTKIVVKPSLRPDLRVRDLSTASAAERNSQVNQILREEGRQIFDLTNGPLASFHLVKLSSSSHQLVFTAHMIICDGWGFKVVLEEVSEIYSAFVEKRQHSLEPVKQMREYKSWQDQERGSVWAEECEDFWLSQFDTLPPPFELPSSSPRPPARSFEADRISLRLTPEFYQDIKRVAKELRNTPFALLLTAYEIWLARLGGLNDFVVGVPFAGQGSLGLKTLVGQCVHTLPFRVRVEDGTTFNEQLAKTRSLILDAQEYWNSNFGAIVQKLDLPADPSRIPLVSVMFNLDPPMTGVRFSGCEARISSGPRFYFHYDLGFNVIDEGETLLVECDYNSNLFDAGIVRHWVDSFKNICEAIVASPGQQIRRMPLLSVAEQRSRAAHKTTSTVAIKPQTIQGLIEAQVIRTPNAVAMECGNERITYSEMNNRSNQLANYLRKQGLRIGDRVGIYLNRSLDMMIGIIGALKAGAAFTPIDSQCSKGQMEGYLRDITPAFLLTHESLLMNVPGRAETRILCMDRDRSLIATEDEKPSTELAECGELACIYQTSGSSGQPKPVEISHGAMVNLLLSMAQAPGVNSHDVILFASVASRGTALLEMFLPLVAGARLALAAPQVLTDPLELNKAIQRAGITIIQATPTTWRMLFDKEWKGNSKLKILCGGEPLTPRLASQLLGSCGEVWNLYGSLETTMWSTAGKLERGQPVTVGRVIANTTVRILDDQLEEVAPGVPGEIFIGAAPLALHCSNLSSLNAERFVPGKVAEERLYRTGDIGRYRADGQIDVAGPLEFHIKLREHRIDLGQIEAVLFSHPLVHEAAVLLREDAPSEPRLVAYLSFAGEIKDSGPNLPVEIRQLVRSKLPAYMTPAAFVTMDKFPRTPAGKLDRRSLPVPSPESFKVLEEEHTVPRNETQERLARLWCEILKTERVSIRANFFDLGGQSLLAASLFSKIEKEFGTKLPLATLFKSPTIEELALALSEGSAGGEWASLVQIQPKGSKPPLFLVHGAGGNVLLYRSLAEHLSPDYPLYGLQSQGLDERKKPLHTIEEMAECYLREVREVQPKGPYYLGGYCLGGTVALEMAQRLLREGEDVALVAMLDTYNFSRALKVSFHSFLLQKAKFHLSNFARLRPREMVSYLKEKTRLALGGELSNLKSSTPNNSMEEGVGRATSGIEASIQAINDYAAEYYIPKPYPGELTLFKPRLNYKFYPDPEMGWGDIALSLDIAEITTNPHAMLLEPYVRVLAEQLKARIDGPRLRPEIVATTTREEIAGPGGNDLCSLTEPRYRKN